MPSSKSPHILAKRLSGSLSDLSRSANSPRKQRIWAKTSRNWPNIFISFASHQRAMYFILRVLRAKTKLMSFQTRYVLRSLRVLLSAARSANFEIYLEPGTTRTSSKLYVSAFEFVYIYNISIDMFAERMPTLTTTPRHVSQIMCAHAFRIPRVIRIFFLKGISTTTLEQLIRQRLKPIFYTTT